MTRNPTNDRSPRPGRMPVLDLLRFGAAAAVMMYHYGFRGSVGEDRYLDVAFEALRPVCQYGYLGVPLFFMISGFVIVMSAVGKSPGQFVTSRASRLYPAYWICCLLTALVIVLVGDTRFSLGWPQVLLNLTMFHRHIGIAHIDGVYWSLVVELQFYLFIFLLIAARQLNRLPAYLAGWLALCETAKLIAPSMSTGKSLVSLAILAPWSCFFVGGAALYLIRTRKATTGLLLLVAASYAASMKQATIAALSADLRHGQGPEVLVVGLTVTAFYVVFGLIAADRLRVSGRPWMAALGAITYPLYLLHQNIGYILINAFDEQMNRYLLLAAVIILMLAAAGVVHRYVERPLSPVLRRGLENLLSRRRSEAVCV